LNKECEKKVINEVDDAVEVWWKHCEEQYTHKINIQELITHFFHHGNRTRIEYTKSRSRSKLGKISVT